MIKTANGAPIDSGAGLAPMAGVTDVVFRLICREMGSSYAVSEMISAKGFLYMPRTTRASVELLRRAPQEGPVAVQLFGKEPELMAEAANQLSGEGFSWIDINMGCPAHKIVGNGEGSALMTNPKLAEQIVRAVVRKTKLPVAVKIRAGWDESQIVAAPFARKLEDAGASFVTVHARTRNQFYSGRADWGIIRDVVRAVTIPVIGNGDILSGADAIRMREETGCAGVMIGRAAQGNPWIFEDVRRALRGEILQPPDSSKRVLTALRHLDMMVALRGERSGVPEMRKHIAWYLHGLRGGARMRAEINSLETADAVRSALFSYLDAAKREMSGQPENEVSR